MKQFVFAIALVALFVSCSDENITSSVSQKTDNSFQSLCSFEGTEWKLSAFVDVVNGTTYIPKGLEDLPSLDYCLFFAGVDETTGEGVVRIMPSSCGYSNSYVVDCSSSAISITPYWQSTSYGEPDSKLFIDAIKDAETFTMSVDTLKLFYNNGKNYLLFKNIR